MRYYDETTQTYKELSIKALDSMPVGTIVEYDGQTSDIPSGWEQESDDPSIYSTTETNRGKTWIDGKPIYRKVLSDETRVSSGNTKINHNISNLKYIISFTGSFDFGGAEQIPIFGMSCTSSSAWDVSVTGISSTQINITAGTSISNARMIYRFVIEYTKTTD